MGMRRYRIVAQPLKNRGGKPLPLSKLGDKNPSLSITFPSLKENNLDFDGRFFGPQLLPVDVVQISRSLARYSISLEITGSMFTVLWTRHVVSFLFHERGKRG